MQVKGQYLISKVGCLNANWLSSGPAELFLVLLWSDGLGRVICGTLLLEELIFLIPLVLTWLTIKSQ